MSSSTANRVVPSTRPRGKIKAIKKPVRITVWVGTMAAVPWWENLSNSKHCLAIRQQTAASPLQQGSETESL
ncbi:hypothetical protein BC937DRAFT_89329 [Endogone sp. FLAS-F59071]|nr:hypothetical protein BC937DRAFT_89329 [Endogone sp. FLAS-F59071]|eukprot:RUS17942.1 hypothetical protein BC937DRAFT_89329 [Endogone sp. FLAS-F59071]